MGVVENMNFIQTIVISLMISGIFTENTVRQIDVKTSDCDECGMTFLGQLSAKLCGSGPGACCVAENLDNIFGDDFNTGELSSFTGSNIGECNGFDLGSTNLDLNNWTGWRTIRLCRCIHPNPRLQMLFQQIFG